jgi:hypothetical protein
VSLGLGDISGLSQGVSPMNEQLRKGIPVLAKMAEDAEAEYPPTCGNRINRIKDPRSGVWRCKTRLSLIDITSPGCDWHGREIED